MAISAKKQVADEQAVHYVSERKKRARPKGTMQPPMTPMIDVTFQLLLFFILTMQFRQAEGQIPADLPSEDGPKSPVMTPLDDITVLLQSGGEDPGSFPVVEIEKYGTGPMGSWGELHQTLVALKGRFSDENPVIIKPKARVRWTDVINAYNQARRAGYKVVGFAPTE